MRAAGNAIAFAGRGTRGEEARPPFTFLGKTSFHEGGRKCMGPDCALKSVCEVISEAQGAL